MKSRSLTLFEKRGKREKAYTESILEAVKLFQTDVQPHSAWWHDRMGRIEASCQERRMTWQIFLDSQGEALPSPLVEDGRQPSPVDNLAVHLLNEEWWDRIKPAHEAWRIRKEQALRSLGEQGRVS